jgi:hypothetical protein
MHTLACTQLRKMELITRGDRADYAPSVRSPHLTAPFFPRGEVHL